MDKETEVYEVWLVEGFTCFEKEVSLYAIFRSRKEAREWVRNHNEAHTHYSIRKSEVA